MLGRVFMNLSGPKDEPSKCGSYYVSIIVDDYTRTKRVRFTKGKSSKKIADVLRNFIADVATTENLTTNAIRADEGGESEGDCHELLTKQCIHNEVTAPETLQCNGVAETLGLLTEKEMKTLESRGEAQDKGI